LESLAFKSTWEIISTSYTAGVTFGQVITTVTDQFPSSEEVEISSERK
jgi:hypothetical protein